MKKLVRATAHKLAIATGKRASAPTTSITYTKKIGEEKIGVEWCEVIPAQTVLPTAHPITAPTTSRYDDDAATRDYPSAFYAKMRGASIVGSNVLDPAGRVIGDLSVEAGVRPENVANHSLLTRPSIAPYKFLSGRSACIVNAYAGNYYHWLIEVVPRYELLKRFAPQELEGCERIIFNGATSSFHLEIIKYLGIEAKVFQSDEQSYRLEEMLVPSLAGIMINPPPWASRLAREALIGMGEQVEDESSPLLYLSRADATRRRVSNEAEIIDFLVPLGFEVVFPDRLSVAQQVRLFSKAKFIVSPHGAALTNCVFCPPGTKVIEIFSPTEVPPCYWLIASHGSLEYRSLVGQNIAQSNSSIDQIHSDIMIDIVEVKKMLYVLGIIT